MTEKIEINALELGDDALEALALARFFGYLTKHPSVNSLADGGAQLIRCFGREETEESFPEGLLFMLTPAEKEFMESIIAQVLAEIGDFRDQYNKFSKQID
ncbi:MAG: hypothetical protein ABII10_02395 [Candidatus Paceibacterota bacterium]